MGKEGASWISRVAVEVRAGARGLVALHLYLPSSPGEVEARMREPLGGKVREEVVEVSRVAHFPPTHRAQVMVGRGRPTTLHLSSALLPGGREVLEGLSTHLQIKEEDVEEMKKAEEVEFHLGGMFTTRGEEASTEPPVLETVQV